MKSKSKLIKIAALLLLVAMILPCVSLVLAASQWSTGRRSSENTLNIGDYEIDLDKSDELTEKVYFSSNLLPYNGEFNPANYAAALAAAEQDNGETIADSKVTLTRTNVKSVNYSISLVDTGYGNNAQLRSVVHITAYKVVESTGSATAWTHTAFDSDTPLTGALGGGSETFHIFMTAEGGFARGTFKFDLVLTSMLDEPDYEADYSASGLMFYDSFDTNYTDNWQITQSGTPTTVTQNESSVTIKKNLLNQHGFITRKNFTAPTGAFTYSFRTKINSALTDSRSVAEFAIRAADYMVRVVLVYNEANPTQGVVQDDYNNPTKQFTLDTTEWHDYQVVVDSSYSYSLYVDGALAWSGAVKKASGTAMLKIGADNKGNVSQSGMADFDLDYFKLETGARAGVVRLLSGMFKDDSGDKLLTIDETAGDVSAAILLENTFGLAQTVVVKMELIENGGVIKTVSETVSVQNGAISEVELTMSEIPADRSGLKIKVTLSVGTASIPGGIILAPEGTD